MDPRNSRQGFLVPHARARLNEARIGLVGYGGGGSHVGQQFAHVKVLVLGVVEGQVLAGDQKLRVAPAHHEADALGDEGVRAVELIPTRWQDRGAALRACDMVVGCIDSAQQRDELERECRKWLIPYVDIGLGITLPLRLCSDGTVRPPEEYVWAPLPARCVHYPLAEAGPATLRRI